MDGFSKSYRLDRNKTRGGVSIFLKSADFKVYNIIIGITAYSVFCMKITASVTKSSHQGRGSCYLHFLIFFLDIHSLLLLEIKKLLWLLFLSENQTTGGLVTIWLKNATHCQQYTPCWDPLNLYYYFFTKSQTNDVVIMFEFQNE